MIWPASTPWRNGCGSWKCCLMPKWRVRLWPTFSSEFRCLVSGTESTPSLIPGATPRWRGEIFSWSQAPGTDWRTSENAVSKWVEAAASTTKTFPL